ncbi:MAG TPA: DUF296 domain-containing protein, partial [Candidatus Omnitrophota bacterium]|nr:DUF296 domain-containing protein [Candidatus Omnitrophota bacterium]
FIRFDNGDDIVSLLCDIADKEKISVATVSVLGAIEEGTIVSGPKKVALPPDPNVVSFNDGREVVGSGTITRKDGKPRIHLHASFGSGNSSLTGCLRKGSKTFITLEAVVSEIKGLSLERTIDPVSGIDLITFQ